MLNTRLNRRLIYFVFIFSEVIPNQVLENILALEEGIGEAETTEPYLQAEILKQKFKFYKNYSIIVREKLEQT